MAILCWAAKNSLRGTEGKMVTIDSCFYLPMIDGHDDIQVIHAYVVDNITQW
jgi:hypothetical protein